jgi:hypothetical protein
VKTVGRVGQAVPGPRRFPHWRGWTPPCSRAASAPRPPPAVECPRSAHRKSTPRAARPRSCSWPQRVSQAAVPERHGPHQEKPSSASHGTRAGSFTYSSK